MLYRSWASLAGRSAAGRRQASTFKIVTLPGDGVGPKVTEQSMKVLRAIAAKGGVSFDFEEHLIGGAAIDATGSALPDETLEACQASDAVLLGAVGGPKWDGQEVRPEQGGMVISSGRRR